MKTVKYRLVNVFCPESSNLQGNALCVFEDGSGLSDAEMQGLALQTNLSETTFLVPATTGAASKRVRIFTPGTELPFAGHPTLGSAFVVAQLDKDRKCAALELGAGVIPVAHMGHDVWSLKANTALFARGLEREQLALLFHLPSAAIRDSDIPSTLVNAGIPQLMAQLDSEHSLFAARLPSLQDMAALDLQGVLLFVKNGNSITSRFFFRDTHAVFEDPGTGSACANLGRLFQRHGIRGTFALTQGHVLKRLCEIGIVVGDEDVEVNGRVVHVGTGEMFF